MTDIRQVLSDPAFRERYEREAQLITKLIPTLCSAPNSALMALVVSAAALVLTSEADHRKARRIVEEAVALVFDAWERDLHDLANTPAKGKA